MFHQSQNSGRSNQYTWRSKDLLTHWVTKQTIHFGMLSEESPVLFKAFWSLLLKNTPSTYLQLTEKY